jgi:phosphatidylinositol alpha-1,6-mannosyltransferase
MILLSYDYPPNDGGIARLCEAIAIGGVRLGIPVHVVAPHSPNGRTDTSATEPETRVHFRRPRREWNIYWVLRHLRTSGPVVTGLWYPDGLLAWLAGNLSLVILAHGSELMPAPSALNHNTSY